MSSSDERQNEAEKEDDYAQEHVIISPRRIKGSQNLYYSAFAMYLGAVCVGITLGFSSPLIKSMKDDKTTSAIVINDSQESWIGSLVTLGAMAGGFIATDLMHRGGRKFCAMLTTVPYVAGFLLISYSSNVATIYVGRFFCGIGTGITSLVAPAYVTEIAPPQLRGFLGSGNQLSIVAGIVISYVVGDLVTWRWFAIIVAVFPTLMGVLCLFIKESPRFLYFKNHQLEAVQALHWLRGEQADCSREIRDLEESFRSGGSGQVSWRELFMRRQYRTPLVYSLLLMFFQQFSGINAIMFYLETIFESAGFTTDKQLFTSSLLVSAVQLFGTLVACAIVDRLGRKTLLMSSSALMCVSLTAFSLYFKFSENQADGYLSWLSLTSVMIFVLAFSIGLGPVPWFMVSELVSTRALSKSAGMATFFNYLCAFIVTKEFADMQLAMTSVGVFAFFAGICGISFLFSLLVVPETKGKSLEEIQDLFKPRNAEYESLA